MADLKYEMVNGMGVLRLSNMYKEGKILLKPVKKAFSIEIAGFESPCSIDGAVVKRVIIKAIKPTITPLLRSINRFKVLSLMLMVYTTTYQLPTLKKHYRNYLGTLKA